MLPDGSGVSSSPKPDQDMVRVVYVNFPTKASTDSRFPCDVIKMLEEQ